VYLFYKRRASKDGLNASCKKCFDAYQKRYKHTEIMRIRCKEYNRKWRERHYNQRLKVEAEIRRNNKKQIKARSAIQIKLNSKKLIRPTVCELHDSTCVGRIEAHHWHGYDKKHWLDVQWLCIVHHRQEDKLSENKKWRSSKE
jgi:hypothetical protein